MEAIGNPHQALVKLSASIGNLLVALKSCVQEGALYDSETMSGVFDRWSKVHGEFVSKRDPIVFNVSKIPDVYDCARYDCLHNFLPQLREALREVFALSKWLAFIVIPQEYGMTKGEKISIARKISKQLRVKLIRNLRVAAQLDESAAAESVGGQAFDVGAGQINRFNQKGSGFLDMRVRDTVAHSLPSLHIPAVT
jgi:inositol hexakisphosphate/diphosphoinositol-pentakisphosphate kinase